MLIRSEVVTMVSEERYKPFSDEFTIGEVLFNQSPEMGAFLKQMEKFLKFDKRYVFTIEEVT